MINNLTEFNKYRIIYVEFNDKKNTEIIDFQRIINKKKPDIKLQKSRIKMSLLFIVNSLF